MTPANYKFRLKAVIYQLGRRIQVLQLTPRKKKAGLFKGELWVDEATGMPLRESGKLVKAPHPLLKGLAFTREYQISDGLAVPVHDEVTIDVRFWGTVALNISFTDLGACDGRTTVCQAGISKPHASIRGQSYERGHLPGRDADN